MSSIGYTLGIPAAADDPSVDQPNMQVNNDANALIWTIDHLGFNVQGSQVSGQHQKVTFNAPLGSPPNNTTPIAALFTQTVASNSELFYQNNASPSASVQLTNSVNGYPKVGSSNSGQSYLPGGFQIKWGLATGIPSGGSTPFTYVGSFGLNNFATTTLSITATIFAAAGTVNVVNPTAVGFTLATSAGSGGNIFWIAIGN